MFDAATGTETMYTRSLMSKPQTCQLMQLSRSQLAGLIADGRLEVREIRGRAYITTASIRRTTVWLRGAAA